MLEISVIYIYNSHSGKSKPVMQIKIEGYFEKEEDFKYLEAIAKKAHDQLIAGNTMNVEFPKYLATDGK